MNLHKCGFFGVILVAIFLVGADARAVEVRFTTVGTFTGGDLAGTGTYLDAANGVTINFSGVSNALVNVPLNTSSQAGFGTFDSSGTTRSPGQDGGNWGTVSSDFILDIFQVEPTVGQSEFVGALGGRLHSEGSQAFIQFHQPLSALIDLVSYEIANADRNLSGVAEPGRVNIVPPSTNQGQTVLHGLITPIPEPGLAALVLPAMLLLRRRAT
jgi:hypothetical protein